MPPRRLQRARTSPPWPPMRPAHGLAFAACTKSSAISLRQCLSLNFGFRPEAAVPLALAKLQNKASVLHRSFARKMLRFFKALDLERNC